MANTATYWRNAIGDYYISLTNVKIYYGLTDEEVANGFDALFSIVSIESILFYAVGYIISVFEKIIDNFRTEIQTTVDAAFVANDAWWHAMLSEFQRGYDLVLNTTTFKYAYSAIDASAQIITRRAVRQKVDEADNVYKVFLYVATTDATGQIAAITDANDLVQIQSYIAKKKYSGVLTKLVSGPGDVVDLNFTINYNPLLMNSSGELISDGSKSVELAIHNFIDNLNNINFGGKLNITKLVDAVQDATGVVDPKLTGLTINGNAQAELWGTYESTNGWFSVGDLTIIYQPQTDL